MKYSSLKTKTALAASALFITFVSLISFVALSCFEAEFRTPLTKEQISLVSSIARDIEEKIVIAQKGPFSLFDNGIFLIAESPYLPNRQGAMFHSVTPTSRLLRPGSPISPSLIFPPTIPAAEFYKLLVNKVVAMQTFRLTLQHPYNFRETVSC